MSLLVSVDEIVETSTDPRLTIAPHWDRVRLAEVADVLNGFAFKSGGFSPNDGMPLIRIRDVGRDSTAVRFDGPFDDRYLVRTGDFLIGMDGDFRIAEWRGGDALLNQRVCRVQIRRPEFYEARFLLLVMPAYLEAIWHRTSSVTVKHLSSKTVQDIPLPLPPREEQRRIVAAIEEQFSRLDQARSGLRRSEALLARLRQAVIDRTFPTVGGTLSLVEAISEPLVNGRSVRSREGGFPVLTLQAIRDGRIDPSQKKEGDWDEATARRSLVEEGDFLVARGNGSLRLVGRGGLVDASPSPVAFPDTMIRVRPDPRLLSRRYLRLVWDSAAVRRQIEGQAKTTAGIYKVNQSDLRAVRLPRLTLSDQDHLAAAAERDLSVIDSMAAMIAAAQRRSATLRRGILGRAFRGDLVPQDPTDEPAAALLERVRAERAASATSPRRRVRSGA